MSSAWRRIVSSSCIIFRVRVHNSCRIAHFVSRKSCQGSVPTVHASPPGSLLGCPDTLAKFVRVRPMPVRTQAASRSLRHVGALCLRETGRRKRTKRSPGVRRVKPRSDHVTVVTDSEHGLAPIPSEEQAWSRPDERTRTRCAGFRKHV